MIATMAVLGAAPFLVVGSASVVSIAAGLYSIRESKTFESLAMSATNFFKGNALDSYLDYVWAPDLRIVHKDTLRVSYSNQMLSCNWFPETGELLPSVIAISDESIGGGGFYSPAPPVPLAPPPDNIATVTIGPLEFGGDADDSGDEYGCCTGGSDGYV
ncbi:hypothetical protein [Pseudomonas baetica]|uniref:hypothetical protein n=1 Tax=Pseudomonas baetica TaxID=674054 RepID=UPI002406E66D|nr:hypothetical protein [Pseudomonas baetica]MDF9776858.1 hypothetical protein [Pseudomonas baetica]